MSYFSKLRSQSNDGIAARLHRSVGGQSTGATGPSGLGDSVGQTGPDPGSPQGLAVGLAALGAGMLGGLPDATMGIGFSTPNLSPNANTQTNTNNPPDPTFDDPGPADPGPGPGEGEGEGEGDGGDGGGGGDGGSALRRGGRARR